MIGPLTLRACNAVDEFINKLGANIHTNLNNTTQCIGRTIWHNSVLLAAHAVCKHQEIHPRFLWGNLWFFYYQAWMWKFSKKWREIAVEKWLKSLDENGELEALLSEPGKIY